jgi:hypothetical protein
VGELTKRKNGNENVWIKKGKLDQQRDQVLGHRSYTSRIVVWENSAIQVKNKRR